MSPPKSDQTLSDDADGIVGIKDYLIVGVTLGEAVAVLDSFYADAANARVPVMLALRWAKLKIEGGSPESLDSLASFLRSIVIPKAAK